MLRLYRLSALITVAILLPLFPVGAAVCSCHGPDETAKTCLTMDNARLSGGQRVNINSLCNRLPSVVGDSLRGWVCDATPLTENQAKSTAYCATGPMDAFAAGRASEPVGTRSTEDQGPAAQAGGSGEIVPELNVPIPDFEFVTDGSAAGNSSLFAQYIAGAYRYLISIAAVAATIMFIYGAFLFLLGSALPKIAQGKEIMVDAVVGLILVLASHLILRTVNPATLSLRPIAMLTIDPIPFSLESTGGDSNRPLAATVTLPRSADIYCPGSGGTAVVRQIVASMQGKVAYRWGGKGGPPPYSEDQTSNPALLKFNNFCPAGNICLDCSGYVNYVLRCAGIPSPGGGTESMFQNAERVSRYDLKQLTINDRVLEAGDLIGWRKATTGHVFIYLGDGLISDSKSGLAGREPGANPRVHPLQEKHLQALTHIIRVNK